MRYWAILAFVLTVFTVASADVRNARAQTSIVGEYAIEGTNPDKSTYTGTVTIAQDGAGYRFEWTISNGDKYSGKSTSVNGNTITVDWGASSPVIYVVGFDRGLRGTWDNGRGTENLMPK
jgi:hypothetical protein